MPLNIDLIVEVYIMVNLLVQFLWDILEMRFSWRQGGIFSFVSVISLKWKNVIVMYTSLSFYIDQPYVRFDISSVVYSENN